METSRKRVLFVDDEPHLLSGLKRSLRGQRNEWDMIFAGSGQEALDVAAQQPVDAIVSDMRMPGMSGAELLSEMADRYPNSVRFVLSGQSDEASILKLVGTTHQFLAKPCDVETLKASLSRAFALQRLLSNEPLRDMVKGLSSLPSMPKIYRELTEMLKAAPATVREIGGVIAKDPPLTAKLLQVVNSAFFGVGRHISDPEQAASLLGTESIKNLVLTTGLFHAFESKSVSTDCLSVEALWQHDIRVGHLAQKIAKEAGCAEEMVNDALAAGLLHDIGVLILAFHAPETWMQICEACKSQGITRREAEHQVTGTQHDAIGAYLLGLWGLPNSVVEAVAFSHVPSELPADGFNAVSAVHVADALLNDERALDLLYLEKLGVSGRIDKWRELAEGEG